MDAAARSTTVDDLIQLAARGRPWFECKIIVIHWPGRPEDYHTVPIEHIRVAVFATHLEYGLWCDDNSGRRRSHQAGISKTPCIDLTSPTLQALLQG